MGVRTLSVVLLLNAAAAAPGPTVTTEFGPVTGHEVQGVVAWLGVPFAAPPVGALRWKEPQSPNPWSSPLDAKTPFFCLQTGCKGTAASCGSEEHCLEADVWAPVPSSVKSHVQKSPATVLAWIHGGGNSFTGPKESVFDGSKLVLQSLSGEPVIVVAIGYRLGGLGFMASPELTAESSHGSSGNYGFLDQVLGLKWIKRNIQSFGAAPNARVTIFGESAGAWDSGAHIASPLSVGLFDAAIMESTYQAFEFYNLSTAERGGTYCGKQCLKNHPTFTDPVVCLRSLTGYEAQLCLQDPADVSDNPLRSVIPVNVDGYALKCSPLDAISARSGECGVLPSVPVIVGSSKHEGHIFTTMFKPLFDAVQGSLDDFSWKMFSSVAAQYGKSVPESKKSEVLATVHKLYPAGDQDLSERAANLTKFFHTAIDTEWVQKVDMYGSDLMFGCSAYFTAKALATRATTPAYLYLFTHKPSQPILSLIGATHTSEMPYIFGTFNDYSQGTYPIPIVNRWTPTAEERALSKTMMEYWLNFARTGVPSAAAAPGWPVARLARSTLSGFLNASISPQVEMDAAYNHAEHCEFWMSAAKGAADTQPVLV